MSAHTISLLLHELTHCYQTYELISGRYIRSLGLTPSQYDVLTVLGQKDGMYCGDLGDAALITKGTLTGVLDRLEKKNLIVREVSQEDHRSIMIYLSPQGLNLYHKLSGRHLEYILPAFDGQNEPHIKELTAQLTLLRSRFTKHGEQYPIPSLLSREIPNL